MSAPDPARLDLQLAAFLAEFDRRGERIAELERELALCRTRREREQEEYQREIRELSNEVAWLSTGGSDD